MRNKIFKFGRHTLSFIYLPSHKLFAIKCSNRGGDRIVELQPTSRLINGGYGPLLHYVNAAL
jgi:hypothetical protein